MEWVFVMIMTRRSMPMPKPPVGGMPLANGFDEFFIERAGLFVAGIAAMTLVDEEPSWISGSFSSDIRIADLTRQNKAFKTFD